MTDSTRQYTPADDAIAALVLQTIHRLQHSRGYDTRSDLHAAVMVELGDPDEAVVDDTVYDYCWHENVMAERDEDGKLPFGDVKL